MDIFYPCEPMKVDYYLRDTLPEDYYFWVVFELLQLEKRVN
jgi:hypothetical protein